MPITGLVRYITRMPSVTHKTDGGARVVPNKRMYQIFLFVPSLLVVAFAVLFLLTTWREFVEASSMRTALGYKLSAEDELVEDEFVVAGYRVTCVSNRFIYGDHSNPVSIESKCEALLRAINWESKSGQVWMYVDEYNGSPAIVSQLDTDPSAISCLRGHLISKTNEENEVVDWREVGRALVSRGPVLSNQLSPSPGDATLLIKTGSDRITVFISFESASPTSRLSDFLACIAR